MPLLLERVGTAPCLHQVFARYVLVDLLLGRIVPDSALPMRIVHALLTRFRRRQRGFIAFHISVEDIRKRLQVARKERRLCGWRQGWGMRWVLRRCKRSWIKARVGCWPRTRGQCAKHVALHREPSLEPCCWMPRRAIFRRGSRRDQWDAMLQLVLFHLVLLLHFLSLEMVLQPRAFLLRRYVLFDIFRYHSFHPVKTKLLVLWHVHCRRCCGRGQCWSCGR